MGTHVHGNAFPNEFVIYFFCGSFDKAEDRGKSPEIYDILGVEPQGHQGDSPRHSTSQKVQLYYLNHPLVLVGKPKSTISLYKPGSHAACPFVAVNRRKLQVVANFYFVLFSSCHLHFNLIGASG